MTRFFINKTDNGNFLFVFAQNLFESSTAIYAHDSSSKNSSTIVYTSTKCPRVQYNIQNWLGSTYKVVFINTLIRIIYTNDVLRVPKCIREVIVKLEYLLIIMIYSLNVPETNKLNHEKGCDTDMKFTE